MNRSTEHPTTLLTLLCFTILLACLQSSPISAQTANGAIAGFVPKFADVEGLRTRYYEVGQGEPMLLVHGSGYSGTASANTWYRNLRGLGEHFHVFAPDKLAAGMTDNPVNDEDFTIRGEVEHMYSFIRTMNIAPVHLVGQSRGGGLAFLLAANHPEVVRTLVIIDSSTAAPPAGDDRGNRRERLFAGCPEQENAAGDQFRCNQAALAYDPVAVTDEYVAAAAYMWQQPKAQETERRVTGEVSERNAIVTSEMNHDAYHRISTQGALNMPVLLYWGKNDLSVLPTQAYSLYNIIAESNSRAWLLFTNHGGHFHYQEHPEEFNRNIVNFVTAWD
jgi:pimeloyl-ACP methyl ester carboxylesterase